MVHRRHTSRSDASSGQPGLFTRPLTAFGRDGFIGQDIYLGKPTVGQDLCIYMLLQICINTTSKPLCRSISRYFIRFLEKDSSRKLIFFLIFGRRFLEKDDFQQDPLLFETRPTPSCKKILKKMADGLAGDAQMRCISNKNIH